MASEYLVPSLKMWPTSMPRLSSRVPAQRGHGSPARAEREVGHRDGGEVAAGDDPDQVGVGAVGAGRGHRMVHHRGVGQDPHAR